MNWNNNIQFFWCINFIIIIIIIREKELISISNFFSGFKQIDPLIWNLKWILSNDELISFNFYNCWNLWSRESRPDRKETRYIQLVLSKILASIFFRLSHESVFSQNRAKTKSKVHYLFSLLWFLNHYSSFSFSFLSCNDLGWMESIIAIKMRW